MHNAGHTYVTMVIAPDGVLLIFHHYGDIGTHDGHPD
jgi:hypothetical protein